MSLVLSTFHDWAGRIDRRRAGDWLQVPWREVRGSRWLIVGFGSIGRKVATLARAFGAAVVGARRSVADDADLKATDAMVTMEAIADELPLADVVVLTCPLTEETRGLVDADFLSALRDDVVLVNVARGPVIDTDALLEWLDGDRAATAVLDVFDVEPLPGRQPAVAAPQGRDDHPHRRCRQRDDSPQRRPVPGTAGQRSWQAAHRACSWRAES